MPTTFDPADPALVADPYPLYDRLRAEDPVHWSDRMGAWVLTRYDDVAFALTDARFSAAERPPQRRAGRPTMMVTADPPGHTRLRRVAQPRFVAREIAALRPRVERIVAELLDAVAPAGRMDVVWDLSYPLPVTMIAEILGLPLEDRERLKRWSDAGVSGVAGRFSRPDGGMAGGGELVPYFQHAIDDRRRAPRDDLISDLVAASQRGEIDGDELLDTTIILLTAGNETTTSLIAGAVLALLRHPGQLDRIRSDPSLIATAVEEFLRYEPPVPAVTRRAKEHVEIAGRAIEAGQTVVCAIAAANRDPARFDRPNDFDIARDPNPHIAFGAGIHACIGAPLARLETEVAVAALVARFPTLRLATDAPQWAGNVILRGLRALPVAW